MRRNGVWVLVVFLAGTTLAAGTGGGYTSGPDNSVSIGFTLSNDVSSTSDVTSVSIDGSTASAYTVIWDDIWNITGPTSTDVSVGGLDTALLILTMTDNPDGFNPGESMSFSLDPDKLGDPSYGATIADMTGVEVLFSFEDASTWHGVFVDDPAEGAGLVLAEKCPTVPAPGAMALGSIGMALVGWMRRRRGL